MQAIEERNVLGKDFKMYGTFDEPLFLAKDVAEWIEHSNPTEMVRGVDEDEKLNSVILSAGQRRATTMLTEDGLYEVLMQSRKPIEEGKLVYTLYISGQKRWGNESLHQIK